MSMLAQDWLPRDTSAPFLDNRLLEAAENWARDWFVDAPVRRLSMSAHGPDDLGDTIWHCHPDGLAIGLASDGAAGIGAQVLAVNRDSRPAADTALLDAVGVECLEDLKSCAASSLGLDKRAGWQSDTQRPDLAYRLSSRVGRTSLTLGLEPPLFARLARSALPPRPKRPLGKPEHALEALPITLSASVGSCRVSVAELMDLAANDVLVLGHMLDAPLPLALDGRALARGTCTVAAEAGTIALCIAEVPAA